VALATTKVGNLLELNKGFLLAMEAVEAVRLLKVQRGGGRRRGSSYEGEGGGVVVRVEVEEEDGLESRSRGWVESKNCGVSSPLPSGAKEDVLRLQVFLALSKKPSLTWSVRAR
jgi:hypothetical protein